MMDISDTDMQKQPQNYNYHDLPIMSARSLSTTQNLYPHHPCSTNKHCMTTRADMHTKAGIDCGPQYIYQDTKRDTNHILLLGNFNEPLDTPNSAML